MYKKLISRQLQRNIFVELFSVWKKMPFYLTLFCFQNQQKKKKNENSERADRIYSCASFMFYVMY